MSTERRDRKADDWTPPAPAPAPVASPCTGRCELAGFDPSAGGRPDPAARCLGCRRTLDEITRWPHLSDAGRRAILDRLADERS